MLSAVSGAGEFELTDESVTDWSASSRGESSRRAVRARIVLALAEPAAVSARVAADLGVTVVTVGKWRKRFEVAGVDGLIDSPAGTAEGGAGADRRRAGAAAAVVAAGEVGAGVGVAGADRAGVRRAGVTNKQVAADLRVMEHTVDQVARPVRRPTGWTGWSMSLGRAGRRRSCWTRSRRWWWRRWRRRRRMPPTGRGRRWRRGPGCRKSTIGRIWRRFDLKPHLVDGFKLSTDPLFVEKVVDVVGLYHNPPERAVVLCVDEKSQMQALDRSQPVLPMMPGMPERRTHDYARHGITSLFAAFNIADGTVISRTAPPAPGGRVQEVPDRDRQGRARRAGRPPGLRQPRHPQDPGDQRLAGPAPPLPHALHPDRILLDQPGRTLVRPAHRPTHPPRRPQERRRPGERHPRLDRAWNENPKPFVWTKTADEILDSLAKYMARISGAAH